MTAVDALSLHHGFRGRFLAQKNKMISCYRQSGSGDGCKDP